MKLLLLFLLLLQLEDVTSSGCNKKYYATNQFVCVCNSTYCDEYEEPDLNSGAVIYTSSEVEDRMKMTKAKIMKSGSIKDGSTIRIKIDSRTTYQSIIGFGGAFTDSSGVNIMSLSEQTRERLMQTVYGSKGARYSTGRVPMASTDFSTYIYSYNDNAGDESMSKFALSKVDDGYKIPLIILALNLTGGDLRLFSSPWSAPGWMKSTGKMNGPGRLKDGLKKAWANYFIKFFEEYRKRGVSFWATTVQNEPSSGSLPVYGWQTMYWNSTGERDFVANYLGPAIEHSPFNNTKIICLDDDRIWVPSWPRQVYSDPVASKYVAGAGLHWYLDMITPASLLTDLHNAFPDKFILATEACTGNLWPFHGPILGEWSRAEKYAASIISDMNNFVAGWTDWNLALDPNGGPTWAKNWVDSPIIVNTTSDEFYKQPMHYVIAHFSRFIRPGALRIQSSLVGASNSRLQVSAFIKDGTRVVTILNTYNGSPLSISIEDALGGVIPLNINPKSITTIVWKKQ